MNRRIVLLVTLGALVCAACFWPVAGFESVANVNANANADANADVTSQGDLASLWRSRSTATPVHALRTTATSASGRESAPAATKESASSKQVAAKSLARTRQLRALGTAQAIRQAHARRQLAPPSSSKFSDMLTVSPRHASRLRSTGAQSAQAIHGENARRIAQLNSQHATVTNPRPFTSLSPLTLMSASQFRQQLNVRLPTSPLKPNLAASSRQLSVARSRAKRTIRFLQRRVEMEADSTPRSGAGGQGGAAAGDGQQSGKRGGDAAGSGQQSGKRGGDAAGAGQQSGKRGGDAAGPGQQSGKRGGDVSGDGQQSGKRGGDGVTPADRNSIVGGTYSVVGASQILSDFKTPAGKPLQVSVRDQMGGTCWAMAVIQVLEMVQQVGPSTLDGYAKASASAAAAAAYRGPMSVDTLVKCVPGSGAAGGSPIDALKYLANHQLPLAADVQGKAITCPPLKPKGSGVTMALRTFTPNCIRHGANCAAMGKHEQQMYLTSKEDGDFAPMLTYVDASQWQGYRPTVPASGAIDYAAVAYPTTACSMKPEDGNHIVTLMGIAKQGSKYYWRVLNSWGPEWGVNGFIYLELGVNACGLANYPVGVTLAYTSDASTEAMVREMSS